NIYEFLNRAEAISSPLALELFGFPFVESVFISGNFVSVTKKQNDIEWSDIVLEMREFIRDFIRDGGKVINENAPVKLNKDSVKHKEELNREFSDIEKKIADLLDEYVRPAVEQDGGFISLKKFDKGIVTVSLQGACSGCPSSSMTLKSGIEGLLTKMMPDEVVEVIADND
ncbi:NifU family protein, partial [Flavobacteriales bacterium]|nr:NifU family protein [Flavobacteriales bacterium]